MKNIEWNNHVIDQVSSNIVNKEAPLYTIDLISNLLKLIGPEKTKQTIQGLIGKHGSKHEGAKAALYILETVSITEEILDKELRMQLHGMSDERNLVKEGDIVYGIWNDNRWWKFRLVTLESGELGFSINGVEYKLADAYSIVRF